MDWRDRFASKIEKLPDAPGCWLWTGSLFRGGYGQFRSGPDPAAHRTAWVIAHGSIPDRLYVLHRCDVRCCVNPEHLFLGTHADNMADMVAKGRSPRGPRPLMRGDMSPSRRHPESRPRGDLNGARLHPERIKRRADHPRARLSEVDVETIRKEAERGQRQVDLAKRFGVTRGHINNIVHGRLWA